MQKGYIAESEQSLRISLIGAGNIKYHYSELLKIPEIEVNKQFDGIAETLSGSNVELVLLPDRGAPFEVAKRYKQHGGKKVYGTVPVSDTDFGIEHLKPYISAEVDGKKIIDEINRYKNLVQARLDLLYFW